MTESPSGAGIQAGKKSFKKSRRSMGIIVLLLLVLLVIAVFLLSTVLKDWRQDHVSRLYVTQKEGLIDIKWNSILSGKYRLEIEQDGNPVLTEELTRNNYRLENINYLSEYEVTIFGKNEKGEYIQGAGETIFTRKPQEITTAAEEFEGFAAETLLTGASAQCELTYSLDNEKVAEVDEKGNVKLLSPGTATLTVTAAEDEKNLPATKTVEIKCYPNTLKVPELSIRKTTDTSVTMRLGKVPYAEKYELLRKDPITGKFTKCRSFTAEDFGKRKNLNLQLAKEIGTYCLRASASVGDRRLRSEKSNPVSIESDLDNAPTYSSLTTIMEIHSGDVDHVFTAQGGSGANNAQSMCCTEDGYVVAFVDRGNSIGRLEKYSKDGELLAVNPSTGHLGHANGCTYYPGNGKVYVMKTYASGKYHDIPVFDGQNLESEGSVPFGTAPSGIGYDAPMNQFYMTASSRIYVTDGNLDMIRTIYRKRDYRSQDIAGYNGIAMSCIWLGGSASYIDMYRALNGDYLGSIYAPFGEIESACVDDGYLVMLFNGGYVYRTKKRVDFPG